MDLEASLWLLNVIRCGSFSQCAVQLNVPVSTVSRRIAQLEKQLNTQLLIRNTRHLRLTPAGVEFVSLVKDLEVNVQQMQRWKESQSEVCGLLKLTAPLQFIEWPLSDWLIEFKLVYPKVNVQVIGSNEYLDFYDQHIDIGFRQGPLPDSDMLQRKLFSLEYGLFAPASWKIKKNTTEDLAWLKQQKTINIGAKGRPFPWLIKEQGKITSFQPKAELLLESPKQAIKAAVAGIGVAYTSCFDAREALLNRNIQAVCRTLWPGWVDFFIVYQEASLKSKKLAAFIDFILTKQKELDLLEGVKAS